MNKEIHDATIKKLNRDIDLVVKLVSNTFMTDNRFVVKDFVYLKDMMDLRDIIWRLGYDE